MSKLNRYGKNEWKWKTLNLLVTLLMFIAVGTLFGGGYIILKPKYEIYKQERVRKEQEEKKQQEKLLAHAQKMEEIEPIKEAKADTTKQVKTNEVPKNDIKESESKKAAEEEAAKRIQEEIEARRKEEEKSKQVSENTSASKASDYLIPNSNQKYLSNSDITQLSLREINYAKNEIYARHGRKFKSPELQRYFGSKSWYNGNIEPDNFDISVFNDYERKNTEFLASVEMSMAPNGYELDK